MYRKYVEENNIKQTYIKELKKYRMSKFDFSSFEEIKEFVDGCNGSLLEESKNQFKRSKYSPRKKLNWKFTEQFQIEEGFHERKCRYWQKNTFDF